MQVTLLNYMQDNGVSIDISHGMNRDEIQKNTPYRVHALAFKERDFVQRKLVDQLWSGHVTIFPLAGIQHLQGLWIYPLVATPQIGINPRLMHNFSWSGLDE